jgi:pimeloyl-ACP methyl ester carboxylesterase
MKNLLCILTLAIAFGPMSARAQLSASPEGGPPTKTTFVRLTNNANAIVVEPLTPNPAKSRIAMLVTHPGNANTFNYFIGRELPKYGYRVMMLNYYGAEQTYEEFIAPIAAAIKALRAIPGVEKVVLAGHSSGGPELTSYQDVAENGPKACQGPERIYKCRAKGLENLPKADGVMLLDADSGAPWKTSALNPAVDPHHPRQHNAELDMFDPKNGYNAATRSANYSPEFLKKFFAAQGARANQLINEALVRLEKIEKGEGEFKDDEPFVVAGWSMHGSQGGRPAMADTRLLSKTRAQHLLLKADGSQPVQVIPSVMPPQARPEDEGLLFETTLNVTVRHYLSFQALRLTPDYAMIENNILGVDWRSTPNSIQGNVEGIHVPTLVMSATCAQHVVFLEITYDHSAAKDKELVGVEGADHMFQACKPEYGDTNKRAFDYVDRWLSKPGRF